MCGRYANSRHDGDLLRDFQVASVVDPAPEPSWNVAPTDPGRVVLERLVDDEPDRQLRTLRWGLVPSWAKDTKIAAKLINARSETVTEKPAFKTAASRRRCLVPADGYYEWMVTDNGKVPMFLHGDGILGFAGLYEIRRDPGDPDALAVDLHDRHDVRRRTSSATSTTGRRSSYPATCGMPGSIRP